MDSDAGAVLVLLPAFLVVGASLLWATDRLRDWSHKRHLVWRQTGRWPRKEQTWRERS